MVFAGKLRAPDDLHGAYEAERFLGLRAIQAMQLRDTSPGYAALGAYLFSQAMWLAREVQQNGYAR